MANRTKLTDAAIGDNLSGHPFIDALEARTSKELAALLGSIRVPFKVLGSPYFAGGRHVVIVSLTRPIRKKAE